MEQSEIYNIHNFKCQDFREIPSVKGYLVNSYGELKSTSNGCKISSYVASQYECYRLTDYATKKSHRLRITKLAHRLVYEAFMGPIPKGMWVNHKDGNKLNNHISNLELTTPKQNHEHARDVLRRSWVKGDKNPNSTLSELERKAIKDLKFMGWSNNDLSEIFMVSTATISKYSITT